MRGGSKVGACAPVRGSADAKGLFARLTVILFVIRIVYVRTENDPGSEPRLPIWLRLYGLFHELEEPVAIVPDLDVDLSGATRVEHIYLPAYITCETHIELDMFGLRLGICKRGP